MKKKLIWLLTLVVMIVGIFSLSACGENSTEDSAEKIRAEKVGCYKFYSMTTEIDGETVELKVGGYYMFLTLTQEFVVVELKEDGTYTASMMGGMADTSGTWKVNEEDSKKVDLTAEGESNTWICDGNELHMEEDGTQITLKKVSE